MKVSAAIAAFIAATVLYSGNVRAAPSNEELLRRLEAIESSNAKLARENAGLRDRVRRLEGGKHLARTQPESRSVLASATPVAAYKTAPPPPQPFNWTGIYAGAHVGSGWGTNALLNMYGGTNPGVEAGSGTVNGLLGGGQIGYNYQFGRALVGIEGEYSVADVKGDTHLKTSSGGTAHQALTVQHRGIATVTGRVGVTFQDTMLLYIKGGYAWMQGRYQDTKWQFGTEASATINDNRSGYVVGFGTEYKFDRNWSAKFEYNFMDFGTKTYTVPALLDEGLRTVDGLIQLHTVKVGANYKFN